MIYKRFLQAAPLLTLLCMSSQAAFFDGRELLERLIDYKKEVSQKPVQAAGGFGFVIGVAEALDQVQHPLTLYHFCIPKDVTTGQLADTVLVYLQGHTQNLHHSAHSLVEAALASRYPCKPSR